MITPDDDTVSSTLDTAYARTPSSSRGEEARRCPERPSRAEYCPKLACRKPCRATCLAIRSILRGVINSAHGTKHRFKIRVRADVAVDTVYPLCNLGLPGFD
jgi:hypothetical protein